MNEQTLPVGKLPAALLARLLDGALVEDPQVLVGPRPGFDCAVVEFGDTLLVFKSDPITFVTDDVGWYLVQINTNDIATTGATPRWLLATFLLPENQTTSATAERIFQQLYDACTSLGISIIGGHTEITHGLDRPIAVGTLIGEVARHRLILPSGARPGDQVLLTKGVPIEATAILAREFPERLTSILSPSEIAQAQSYLTEPGISVLREAQIASNAGQVTAMHDPTEGGLASALWELAEACGHILVVDIRNVPVSPLSGRICQAFELDPLACISSGALLLTTPLEDVDVIRQALTREGITCARIGYIERGPPSVYSESRSRRKKLIRPERDEITRVFDS